MFNKYPILPNINLVDLDLQYKMDNCSPLYCQYIIWLRYRMNNQVISSALWQTKSFQLCDIVENLPQAQKEAKLACKNYGMSFIKIRTAISRFNKSDLETNESADVAICDTNLLNWYKNLIWVKKHEHDDVEQTNYIVDDKNENYHKNLLWSYYDTVIGHRDFCKNPLTDEEKSICEKHHKEVKLKYQKWEQEQKNTTSIKIPTNICWYLLVFLFFKNYSTIFFMFFMFVFMMLFKFKL